MHSTGQVYNVAQGSFDSSKGEYRKVGVFAGETTFPNFQKVEGLVKALCENLEKKIEKGISTKEIYDMAFDPQTQIAARSMLLPHAKYI